MSLAQGLLPSDNSALERRAQTSLSLCQDLVFIISLRRESGEGQLFSRTVTEVGVVLREERVGPRPWEGEKLQANQQR